MLNQILVPTGTKQTAVITALALLLAAAALLVFLQSPAEAQTNDRAVGGVTLTSPHPGELAITWDAPSNAPDDYRVTWKKSDGRWHSYKNANTVDGGNAFPTGTSHTVTSLEEGTAYQARVRARYFDDNGNLEQSGPWSDAVEITISATPSQDGEGDSNEGPPAKPTGLLTAASHDSVLLAWDNPDDDSITGYQVLRGPDADNLAVLTDDTGSANTSYTNDTVEAQMTYVYAVKARNAEGLGPQSDPVTATTSAAPEEDDPPTSDQQSDVSPPTLVSATVAPNGESIDLVLNEVYDLPATEAAAITYLTTLLTHFRITADGVNVPLSFTTLSQSPAAKRITWEFASSKVRQGQTVVVTYTDPTSGDDTVALQDEAGNDMASFTTGTDGVPAVVNNSTQGAVPLSAVVPATGLSLDIRFDKGVHQTNLPPASAFSVTANGSAVTVSAISAGSSNDKISLTIGAPGIGAGFDVKVSYTDPTTSDDTNAIQDSDGDDAVSFTDFAVTNNSALDLTPPTLVSATVAPNGESIDLVLNEVYDLPATEAAAITYLTTLLTHFRITADGVNVPLSFTTLSQSPAAKRITWEFASSKVRQGQTVVVTYTDPTSGDDTVALQDEAGNDMASFTTGTGGVPAVTNGSTVAKSAPDAPTGLSATESGTDRIELTWTAPVDNGGEPITGYKIEVSDDAGTTWSDLVANTADQLTSYTHSGLDPGTTRHHRVSAINTLGTSSPSNIDSATTVANATLSALALTDASNNAVTLSPAFASATTSYSATVANSVSQIEVEPTANDSNADIEYLDDSDATLTDADTNTAAFDFDLDVGPNVVKVKVTAEDGTTTETYTVRIKRAEADLLVSNLGQFSNAGVCISTPNTGLATQFTTGSETDGYLITQVRLNIDAESGTIPGVSIYSDSSGQPGSSLKILTNPGAVTTTRTEHDFGADNYKLDPSTSYWIVIERASGSGTMCVSFTRTYTAQDTGSAAGWSIGDNGSSLSSGGTWSTSTRIHLIAVRGTVAPAVSTDATLSALALKDASNNAVTLSPAFASATTSYNATVANSVSQIKVEPTANDSNADIKYLDDSDTTLPDYDTSTAVFDFDLDVGSNVVKVKVTAEDSSTTEIYTVTVTRQAGRPRPRTPP